MLRSSQQQVFRMKKTSSTHPIEIATISAGTAFGRVGITFCPGKYDRHAKTGYWDRDLAVDLDAIRDWGAAAVVTLLEQKELSLLSSPVTKSLFDQSVSGARVMTSIAGLPSQFATMAISRVTSD